MKRLLCLLLLVMSGCGVPQDSPPVVEVTPAKPDSVKTPAAHGKQGEPPPSQAPPINNRDAAAANPARAKQHREQDAIPHVHSLEKLGASVERNDQGEVVFLLLPLGSTITDENLVHLREFPKLEVLVLGNSQIKDAGLRHLRGLANLRELLLGDTQITDAGLVHLASLTKLKILELNNTQITDAGLASLAKLTRLEVLDISYTQVGNSGLQHLSAMRTLARLGANYTRITDGGLPRLATLSSLTDLYLNDTQVSKQAIAKLRQALPHCSIVKD